MFLHAGLGHILFNMLALYFFGPRLELELGGSTSSGSTWSAAWPAPRFRSSSRTTRPSWRLRRGLRRAHRVRVVLAAIADLHLGLFPIEARWMVAGVTALSLFGGFAGGGTGWRTSRTSGIPRELPLPEVRGGAARPHGRGSPGEGRTASGDRARDDRALEEHFHGGNARGEQGGIPEDHAQARYVGEGNLTPEEIAFLERFAAR